MSSHHWQVTRRGGRAEEDAFLLVFMPRRATQGSGTITGSLSEKQFSGPTPDLQD